MLIAPFHLLYLVLSSPVLFYLDGLLTSPDSTLPCVVRARNFVWLPSHADAAEAASVELPGDRGPCHLRQDVNSVAFI